MKFFRILLPLLVLAFGIGIAYQLIKTAPEPKKRKPPPNIPVVEVIKIKRTDFPIKVKSFGTVEPSTQTTLVAEVSGKVVSIADNFHAGDYFSAGDELLRIDDRDYKYAVTIARSELARQKLNLQQEKAQARQALADWQQLGDGSQPSSLVLRKPQVASAEASIASATAQLQQSQTRLKRTRITSPYDGRILETQVNVGQFVSPGTQLGSVYATDYVEIKLPLGDDQIAYLKLPEQYRGEAAQKGPKVTLSKGGQSWQGEIIRTAGAIDSQSQQQIIIARVNNPYGKKTTAEAPLKIGYFVDASIDGETLKDVFVLPRSALRENSAVLLADDDKIRRAEVTPLWSDEKNVVIRGGLKSGDQLIISPVAFAADGARIAIKGQGKGQGKKAGAGKAGNKQAGAAGQKPATQEN